MPTGNEKLDQGADPVCGHDAIEARLRSDGFPELTWLWRRFVRSGMALDEIDEQDLADRRRRHMGRLVSNRRALAAVSICVGAVSFVALWQIMRPVEAGSGLDVLVLILLSGLMVYLFWFLATGVHRSLLQPWRDIAATDLALMLRQRCYRDWLRTTARARSVAGRIAELGLVDRWDDPTYRRWYRSDRGRITDEDPVGAEALVQQALRQVLGHKQDRKFQPGRYLPHLVQGKQSVTRFVASHQGALAQSRAGELPLSAAIRLLTDLKTTEMRPGSAGDQYLGDVIESLSVETAVPRGVTEAYIWPRDPWVDLTHSRDFYSSASLRGNGLMDSLERRSKGLRGPFGYLRNASISALDSRTAAGRGAVFLTASLLLNVMGQIAEPIRPRSVLSIFRA